MYSSCSIFFLLVGLNPLRIETSNPQNSRACSVRMKKLLFFFLLFPLISMVFPGCGRGGGGAPAPQLPR